MTKSILGIDVQPGTVGFSLANSETKEIIHLGVNKLPDMLEHTAQGEGKAKSVKRTAHRSVRNNKAHKKGRIKAMKNELFANNMIHKDEDLKKLTQIDPYELRYKALSEKISLEEFSRIIVHMTNRRGFQTSRKDVQDGKSHVVLNAITSLQKEIENTNSITLGEYMYLHKDKKRGTYTEREMYISELDTIYKKQTSLYENNFLPEDKYNKIKTIIFSQKPLKPQVKFKCPLEGNRKAAKASLTAQEFKVRQTINNIRLKDPDTRDEYPLSEEQNNILFDKLYTNPQKTMSFSAIKKIINVPNDFIVNLESEKNKFVNGNSTSYAITKILKEKYTSLSEDTKSSLITEILTISLEKDFLKRMTTHWNFDTKTAKELFRVNLESGYMAYSEKAIKKLLNLMRRGKTEPESRNTIYKDVDIKPSISTNPRVAQSVYAIQNILKEIQITYPTTEIETVRIEFARSVTMSEKQKKELSDQQYKNRKENEKITEIIKNELNFIPKYKDIQKYRLWEEQDKKCIYSGIPIELHMLFSPDCQVDHVIPYAISQDNSFSNKVVCITEYNQKKGNKIPYEAFSSEEYSKILKRVDATKNKAKRRLFETKKPDTDKFINRLLNETSYIANEARRHLQYMGFNVQVVKGGMTAILRNHWQLNDIISETDEKNRKDHRHHAIDAAVITFVNHSLYKKISNISKIHGNIAIHNMKFPHIESPTPDFKNDVKKHIDNIILAYRRDHRVKGALHDETIFSKTNNENEYSYRVPVDPRLTMNKVRNIVDDNVRNILMDRLMEFNNDSKKAFSEPVYHLDNKTPIKKVRILTTEKNVVHIKKKGYDRYYKSGSNHHAEIFEDTSTGKWSAKYISNFEAKQRQKQGMQLGIKKDYGDGLKYVMSLFRNDTLEVTNNEGNREIYRIQKMSSIDSIVLRKPELALTSDAERKGLISCNANSLKKRDPRKIIINSIGMIKGTYKGNTDNMVSKQVSMTV